MSFVNLDTMFYAQKKLIDKIKEDKPEFFKDPEPWEGYRIFTLCSFLIHEAVELQQECKWKYWKAPENYKIDYENRNVEIADLWHVLIQLSMECGLTADDVMYHFNKKHNANIKRQEDRY
jgi:NTP pyrophosphatase (non-canonical NTP hydrolase)